MNNNLSKSDNTINFFLFVVVAVVVVVSKNTFSTKEIYFKQLINQLRLASFYIYDRVRIKNTIKIYN